MNVAESNYQILVVDDEELIRSSLAKFLERKGFRVQIAESGNNAFDIVKSQKIDLILSDVRMPDGDGPSLLQQVNALEQSRPGLMFITGYSDLSDEDLQESGAICVFSKPVDRQEILSKVKEHFQINS